MAPPLPSATASPSRAQSSDSAASCAFAQSPRSPRPYRISQSIWFPLFRLKHPFYTQRPFASTDIAPLPRYYGLVRLLLLLSLLAVLPSSLAELSGHATLLCPAAFPPPKSIRRLHVGFMLTRHWPRGIMVTRLYEKGSLALSLIRSSGETRAHRSPSARPAFLTVCRLLYSADSFHSASPAEFCSAYVSPDFPLIPPFGLFLSCWFWLVGLLACW